MSDCSKIEGSHMPEARTTGWKGYWNILRLFCRCGFEMSELTQKCAVCGETLSPSITAVTVYGIIIVPWASLCIIAADLLSDGLEPFAISLLTLVAVMGTGIITYFMFGAFLAFKCSWKPSNMQYRETPYRDALQKRYLRMYKFSFWFTLGALFIVGIAWLV